MYRDPSPAAGRIRYEHLNSVVRLTPCAMAANVGCASLVLWAFQGQWTPGLLSWWFALSLIAVLAMLNWSQFRRRPARAVSCRGIGRSTGHAGILAAVWGILPILWFASASPGQQLVIATLVTGMLGAGTFVLGALPLASLLYGGLFTFSALWALISASDPMMPGVIVLIAFYSPMVLVGGFTAWRKATLVLQSQNEAIRNEQMLAIVLKDFEQNASDALWETDRAGCLRAPSQRLASLLRTTPDRLANAGLLDWLQEHQADGSASLRIALARELPFQGVMVSLPGANDADGAQYVAFNGKPLFDELDQFDGWRGVLSDRSSEARAQAELERLAHTDSLTGLANRFAIHQVMERHVKTRQATGALLLIDLDNFKFINDTFGHSAGDTVLIQVARSLEKVVPSHGMVARLGGDEFAVFLHESDPFLEQAQSLAWSLLELVRRPNSGNHRHGNIGASIGIAVVGQDIDSLDVLMMRADIALYAAKAQGRGRFVCYTPALGASAKRRSQIEDGLREAQHRQELELYWQPKVDLQTWEITGTEAIMRWRHATLGSVSPAEFIPVAEQAGIINSLGIWALADACAYAAKAFGHIQIAVNVSAIQLADPRFVDSIAQVLGATGLPANRLEIEITESVLMANTQAVLSQLHAIRNLGVNIALDDFGTGYSSLSYLCRFPFNTLKIDKSFVHEFKERPEALAVVRTIVQLAKDLGMNTVCEGVETQAQLAMARDAGIQAAQGFLFSPPVPRQSFKDLLDTWNPQHEAELNLHSGLAPLL